MIVIFHNPRCSKSRQVVSMVEAAGHEPVIVRYLEVGYTRAQLLALLAVADLTPRELLRDKDVRGIDPSLLDEGRGDDAIIDAMVAHPVLVERPIVCAPGGVRLCRPPERVEALLGR